MAQAPDRAAMGHDRGRPDDTAPSPLPPGSARTAGRLIHRSPVWMVTMIRPRVSVFIAVSLDGFIARTDGGIDWLSVVEDEHGEDYGYGEFIADVDTIVMGRKTFDMVSGFEPWPFAGKRVIVLSHHSLPVTPDGVEAHDGPLPDLILRLGEAGAKRVYLDGGETIRQGLAEDLVDDLTLSHIPVMLGKGRPLFGPEVPHGRWQLLGARHFGTGLVQATYRRLE